MIAVLASLLAGVSAPSAEPYLMAECPAAIRNEPTLDARLAPDATGMTTTFTPSGGEIVG